MALFAIQLVRVVLYILSNQENNFLISSYLVMGIHQMFNVIIKSVHFYFFCFTDNICLTRALHQQ